MRRCVVIDDSVTGITAAMAAGAQAICFTGASHVEPGHATRLKEAGASCVVSTAPDLAVLLQPEAA